MPDAVDALRTATECRRGVSMRLANAYCVALATTDDSYHQLLNNSGVNYPDGTPVAWALRAAGQSDAHRVRGPSFFTTALAHQEADGVRPFFLGSSPSTLAALQTEVSRKFPALAIAGAFSPPFAPIDSDFIDECVSAVEEASADMVWVGLGTPKQDFLSTVLAERVGIPAVGVGAAFDFVAGTVPEAPAFAQKFGLEWAFRFAMEPRRLWKRYTIGNAQFTWAVVRNWRETRAATR
ncbi:WecB/TagA/CpsF family glycosyltransferase [Microbacterium sp. SLBN-154]|uniref:WecB/TagA/CpsF family glycosyltransferase n=1 Tax=Microbacterium sp. SLBN-154 TaxID=2768458 RepID=UPI00190F4A1F|nr:WecB/TagA/CpsF family glycosyltransferase [Microbacterium sp. SLBN-154]